MWVARKCRGERAMTFHCPICKRPINSETDKEFPFCSERCRLQDLGNWAAEKYKVSAPLMDESEAEESEAHGAESESERDAE